MAVVEEGLRVTFEGNTKPLEAASTAAGKSLDKVSAAAKQMAKGAAIAGGSLDKTAKSSGAATQSLVNLSRVAQDSPFGFIGIANNLNPLLESFQRLQIESKATGVSLGSALKGALIGPAGIGVALGIVSSLLVVFGDKLFKSKDKIQEQADAVKKAKQVLADYVDSLNDANKINLEGTQNAQGELVKLQTLYKASQDLNIPLAERKKIVDQLQEQYPKYFKNISDETILAGGASAAYGRLTSSILAASKARAAQDTLVDIQKQLLTTEQQISDEQSKRVGILGKLNNLNRQGKKVVTSLTGEERITGLGVKIEKEERALNASLKDGNKLYDQRFELVKRLNNVSALLTGIVEKDPQSILNPTGNVKPVKTIKTKPEKVEVSLRGTPISVLGIDVFRKELQDKFDKENPFNDFIKVTPRKAIVDFKQTQVSTNLSDKILKENGGFIKMNGAIIDPAIMKQFDELQAKQENLANTVSSVVAPAFQNMFGAITAGEEPIKAFFKSIGQSVTQLIQQLIAAAIQAAILSLITGGASGGGLSFAKAFGKITGFASGGLVFGPSIGMVGEGNGTTRSNPEVIAPLDKLKKYISNTGAGNVEVFGRLSGADILLSSSRVGKSQRRVR